MTEIEEDETKLEELMEGGVELCICKSCMIMFRPEENVDNLIKTSPCPKCEKLCDRTMIYYDNKGPENTKTNLLKSVRGKLHV